MMVLYINNILDSYGNYYLLLNMALRKINLLVHIEHSLKILKKTWVCGNQTIFTRRMHLSSNMVCLSRQVDFKETVYRGQHEGWEMVR